MNALTYLIHLVVLGQPLFFWYIYEKSYMIERNDMANQYLTSFLFIVGLAFASIVIMLNVSFEFYTPNLFVQYTFLVLYAYSRLEGNNNFFKAVSLSFLLVFFNSYLWESVLHFSEYTVNIAKLFTTPRELTHLIVLPFLYYHYDYDKKPILNRLRIILFINFLFSVLYIEIFPRVPMIWSYRWRIPLFTTIPLMFTFFNRWFSLIQLLDIFEKNMREKKEEDRRLFY